MFAVIFGSSEDITTKKGKWLSDVIMQIAQITKLMEPCARFMLGVIIVQIYFQDS